MPLVAPGAQGKLLGRPKGSRNQSRPLDAHREQIKDYLQAGLSIAAIRKLINRQLATPLTYNSYKYFVLNDEQLRVNVDELKK